MPRDKVSAHSPRRQIFTRAGAAKVTRSGWAIRSLAGSLTRRVRRLGPRAGLDAVVVNYRTPDDLASFVESVERHADGLQIDLVIANVAPLAEDARVAEQLVRRSRNGLHIEHLPFADNVGYARACNAAAARGGREVIALFNADTVLTAGALKHCREAVLDRRDWGPLGPRQVDQLGRLTASGIFGDGTAPRRRGRHREPDTNQYTDVRDDAVSVAGSAYFVRRRVWEELTCCPSYQSVAPGAEGAFLPTELFYEETYCSYHAAAHGYRNVYFGAVTIVHTWHGSIDRNAAPAPDLFERSRAYFRRACAAHDIACD